MLASSKACTSRWSSVASRKFTTFLFPSMVTRRLFLANTLQLSSIPKIFHCLAKHTIVRKCEKIILKTFLRRHAHFCVVSNIIIVSTMGSDQILSGKSSPR